MPDHGKQEYDDNFRGGTGVDRYDGTSLESDTDTADYSDAITPATITTRSSL